MKNMKKLIALFSAVLCVAMLAGCSGKVAKTGVEDGVLTVAMECSYAPYNWTQD